MKAVLFDYDGVLTRDKTGSLTTCRFVSREARLPLETVQAAFREHNAGLNAGSTTYAAIWPSICATLGMELPIDILIGAFESTPLNDEMLLLARRLRKKYAVGIVTDNKKDRMDHLRKFQALDDVFSPIVVSAEVGHTKASAAIFRCALRTLAVLPEECVFVDNAPDNLAVAGALGLRTIHFDDERNDVPGLAARLSSEYGVSVAEPPELSVE